MTTVAFYSPALRELPLKQPNELQERAICVVLADSVCNQHENGDDKKRNTDKWPNEKRGAMSVTRQHTATYHTLTGCPRSRTLL